MSSIVLVCVLGARAPVAAQAAAVTCGQTIVADTTLTNDLHNCHSVGIVIGASGVTLDLNGHTIDGDGRSDFEGVKVAGHDGVTIENGTIRDFVEGVAFLDSRRGVVRSLTLTSHRHVGVFIHHSTHMRVERNIAMRIAFAGIFFSGSTGVEVTGNQVHDSGSGVAFRLSGAVRIADNTLSNNECGGVLALDGNDGMLIEHNTLTGNGCEGVVVRDGSKHAVVQGNIANTNDAGIGIDVASDNLVRGNVARSNRFVGLYVFGGDRNRLEFNFVDANGDGSESGIHLLENDRGDRAEDNTVRANRITRSVGDGVWVERGAVRTLLADNVAEANSDDGFDADSAKTTFTRNTANRNADLGIEAIRGVVDGGGNRAARNGDARQCTNVNCA